MYDHIQRHNEMWQYIWSGVYCQVAGRSVAHRPPAIRQDTVYIQRP